MFYDADDIDAAFVNSPYKLKNDIKDLSDNELKKIANDIADELMYGFQRPTCILKYKNGKKCFVGYAKIRCNNLKHQKGKSNGFRCIVLVDSHNFIAYLLHVYTHSDKDNISKTEQNKLRLLVDEYVDSISK